jgi:hypothetical protein
VGGCGREDQRGRRVAVSMDLKMESQEARALTVSGLAWKFANLASFGSLKGVCWCASHQ